jgi:hypothetical protein
MDSNEGGENRRNMKEPVRARVLLRDIVEAMELQSDETTAYLNPATGTTVVITEEEFRAAESGVDDDHYDPEIMKEARGVLDGKDYIALPGRFEIDEYSMMREFALNLSDLKNSETLLVAIQGSGAFRRFKDMVRIMGIEQQWYDFRAGEYEKLAIEWCEQNGIKYDRE